MSDYSTTIFLNISHPNVTVEHSVALQFVRSGCLIICMSGGLFINILFIIIISKTRSFRRRSLFALCLNLACIFFLDIFINQLLTLISVINNSWVFTDVICTTQSLCIMIVDICLSLTLFMLGIDRLVAIRANVKDKVKLVKGLNKDAIALSILCLWLVSICFAIPLVTKTINSKYFLERYSCAAILNENRIYQLSQVSLTIGLPLVVIVVVYIHIGQVWFTTRKEIIKVSFCYTLSEKFQIEKQLHQAVCTFVFHLVWVLMVGPYIVWVYLAIEPNNYMVFCVWLRNFFCWLPFFVIVGGHKSFRTKLAIFITGDKTRSTSSEMAPDSVSNIDELPVDGRAGAAGTSQQNNTYSTNLAFSDHDDDHQQFHSFASDDANSSPSFSYSSSAPSNHKTEYLPKVPVMFATEFGVHVTNEYFPEMTLSRFPATLCDVQEAGFTDTSDATSLATDNSFKGYKVQNQVYDVKLPVDITETYNPEGYKHKRLKRRPQSNSQHKASLNSAFELPNLSLQPQNEEKPKAFTPQKVRKKKGSAIQSYQLPQLFEANSKIPERPNQNPNEFDMDTISTTNA